MAWENNDRFCTVDVIYTLICSFFEKNVSILQVQSTDQCRSHFYNFLLSVCKKNISKNYMQVLRLIFKPLFVSKICKFLNRMYQTFHLRPVRQSFELVIMKLFSQKTKMFVYKLRRLNLEMVRTYLRWHADK